MEKLLNDVFNKIYIGKDYEYFKDRCRSKIVFSKEFYTKTEVYVNDIIEEDIDGAPSQIWYFKYSNYENGKLKVSYKTLLQISKIIPVFYIHHEFEVENYDENKMSPVLDGFGPQPYIKNQADLYEITKEYLEKNGYVEVDYSQLNEIVLNKDNNSTNLINGEKFSVEELIFYDRFEIENTII